MIRPEPTGPLVIAGVGGSGTRVVAEMARRLGVYLGADLNSSGDNLWATLLLRRPEWYRQSLDSGGAEIDASLSILDGAMNGRLVVNPGTETLLLRAVAELRQQGLDDDWAGARLSSLTEKGESGQSHAAWGWKEPNSHVYLAHIHRHFSGLPRYMHVIRNGLDMAYSTNQWQLRTWGWLYGIPPLDAVSVSTALEFWIRANKAAVGAASALYGDRFLLVNFDDLCCDPAGGVRTIVDFLGIDASPSLVTRLMDLPRTPESSGRWRRSGLSAFSGEQLAEVEALGFPVDV